MKFSRDSVIWTLGMIGSVVVGLATLSNPAQYGIPVGAIPYLRLGALLVGIISGKLATSPLPGANDAVSIDPSKVTALKPALVLALGLGMLTVSACGSHTAPVTNPLAAHQQQVAHMLDAVTRVGGYVAQAQAVEQALYAAGDIPAATHAKVQATFAKTADSVLAAIATLKDASATTDPKVAVQAVVTGINAIAADIAPTSAKTAALAGWLQTAAAVIDVTIS